MRGRYVVAIISERAVQYGEELSFDYNSVTENKEEYPSAVCLCGSSQCRGSFLYFSSSATFQQVISEEHTILYRTAMILQCGKPCDTDDNRHLSDFGFKESALFTFLKVGSGSATASTSLSSSFRALSGVDFGVPMPSWTWKFAALVLRFVVLERQLLPAKLMEPFGSSSEGNYSTESAAVDADGVAANRVQNLAITLDKIRRVLRDQPKVRHFYNPTRRARQ